jgi:predicted O-methyltransferase YrrM
MPYNPNITNPPNGWHPDAMLLALADLARGKQTIVEVGTWLGHSALAMAGTCAGKVYCVDHWRGSASGTGEVDDPLTFYESFLDHMRMADHGDRIVPLYGESVRIAHLFDHKLIDLLYIDGDHRRSAVVSDIETWSPHVIPGGLICGDDFGEVQAAVYDCFEPVQVAVINGRLWKVQA